MPDNMKSSIFRGEISDSERSTGETQKGSRIAKAARGWRVAQTAQLNNQKYTGCISHEITNKKICAKASEVVINLTASARMALTYTVILIYSRSIVCVCITRRIA